MRRELGVSPQYVTGLLPSQIVGGAGIGLAMPSFTAVAVGSVHPSKISTAIGLSSMFRQIGGALGIAAFVAITASASPSGVVTAFRHGWMFHGSGPALAGALAMLAVEFVGSARAPVPAGAQQIRPRADASQGTTSHP